MDVIEVPLVPENSRGAIAAAAAKKDDLAAHRCCIVPSALQKELIQQERDIPMSHDNGEELLAEDRRKEIFLAIVDAQDKQMDVPQSRKLVIQRFGVSENQVRLIEREGMDRQWPPL